MTDKIERQLILLNKRIDVIQCLLEGLKHKDSQPYQITKSPDGRNFVLVDTFPKDDDKIMKILRELRKEEAEEFEPSIISFDTNIKGFKPEVKK